MVEKSELELKESGIVRIPENQVNVSDVSIAKQVVRLLELIEDYDDVQNVYTNADINDDILEEIS